MIRVLVLDELRRVVQARLERADVISRGDAHRLDRTRVRNDEERRRGEDVVRATEAVVRVLCGRWRIWAERGTRDCNGVWRLTVERAKVRVDEIHARPDEKKYRENLRDATSAHALHPSQYTLPNWILPQAGVSAGRSRERPISGGRPT